MENFEYQAGVIKKKIIHSTCILPDDECQHTELDGSEIGFLVFPEEDYNDQGNDLVKRFQDKSSRNNNYLTEQGKRDFNHVSSLGKGHFVHTWE